MDALQAKVNRELIKFAVQREIFCPYTKVVLDVRRAVLIQQTGAGAIVCSADYWDKVRGSVLNGIEDAKAAGRLPADYAVEVLDGRDYYLPSGRARAASTIKVDA
jgi:hypothetical protein